MTEIVGKKEAGISPGLIALLAILIVASLALGINAKETLDKYPPLTFIPQLLQMISDPAGPSAEYQNLIDQGSKITPEEFQKHDQDIKVSTRGALALTDIDQESLNRLRADLKRNNATVLAVISQVDPGETPGIGISFEEEEDGDTKRTKIIQNIVIPEGSAESVGFILDASTKWSLDHLKATGPDANKFGPQAVDDIMNAAESLLSGGTSTLKFETAY